MRTRCPALASVWIAVLILLNGITATGFAADSPPPAVRPRGPIQQIFDAIHNNDLVKLRILLRDKPDQLHRLTRPSFETLIMSSSPAVYGCLLDLGLEIDTVDLAGRSALHWAVMKSDAGLVELLLSRGATVDLADNGQATPLMYACAVATPALLQTLLDHGADPARHDSLGNGLFHFAVMVRSNEEVLQKLLDRHAGLDESNVAGLTPLMVACSEPPHSYFPQTQSPAEAIAAKRPVIPFLLEHGAGLQAVDGQHKTLLDYAIQSNHIDLARRCLESGADVNAKRAGLTPLDQALLQRCSPELIDCLASHGAGAPYTDSAGNNHLHMRVAYHYQPPALTAPVTSAPTALPLPPVAPWQGSTCDPVVPVLLKYGFAVNATNKDGETPLHRACEGVNFDSVAMLLDFHADPNAVTAAGLRPLDIAVAKRDPDITRLLLSRGGDPNRTDLSGETPLHRLLTLSTPDDIRDRLTVSSGGKFNKYQQEVQLLYSAQRTLPNSLAWAGALLALAAGIQWLRRYNRRIAERFAASSHEDLPPAVWKSANWKDLAAGAETARALHATRLCLQTWLAIPIWAFSFGVVLCLFDPVFYATLDLTDSLAVFLPGALGTVAGILAVRRPHWLRTLIPPLTYGLILGSVGVFAWQAWVLSVNCRFIAIGSLLALSSALQFTALVLIFRIHRIDQAIRALNLPFDVNATPPLPPEAEEIESHHGWDEQRRQI